MFLLIENGDLYAPEPRGRGAVLIAAGKIVRTGEVARADWQRCAPDLDVIDASGCIVIPGLIDVHEHLIGGSGERGFNSQTPEIYLHELVEGGITSVVGCLGVDTTTRLMPALLAKVKGLRAEGLSAWLYTGGYTVPPATLTGNPRSDIMWIDEVIGVGETAIADRRSSRPLVSELARLASEAYTGGLLSEKAGVLHFHTGDDARRLADVRELLDEYHVPPESVYPTHVERSEALFDEAIELTRRGVTVDVDVIERDLAQWLRRFRERDGEMGRFTASSDAAQSAPALLLDQVRDCVLHHGIAVEDVLPLVTANPARVLKLRRKGRLAAGVDGDVAVLDAKSLELRHVVAGGRVLMRDGKVAVREEFLKTCNRRIHLDGSKEA